MYDAEHDPRAGKIVGTADYLAPEQIRAPGEVSHLIDIYSLGCVAYFLLTAQRVFSGESAVATALAHVQNVPVAPSVRSPFEIPPALETLILDCLAKDPAEREHVTPFIYRRPERYRLKSLTMAPNLSHHRWTVDTLEDFELVSRLLKTLKPQFTLQDVLAVLDKHPDWCAINAHVEQRAL